MRRFDISSCSSSSSSTAFVRRGSIRASVLARLALAAAVATFAVVAAQAVDPPDDPAPSGRDAPRVPAAEPGAAIDERTLEHDGRERVYTVVRPSTYEPGNPAIILLHGGGGGMRSALAKRHATSRWIEIAEREGLVVLAPNGWNARQQQGTGDRQSWNDLRADEGRRISQEDDAGFIVAMLDREQPRLGFDARAVFVTGPSNGGMMTFRVLIEHPERFAAGAAFIANLPDEAVELPEPSVARPVLIVNGDADPLVPWEGGDVGFNGAPVRSTPATVAWWRARHGLDGAAAITLLDDVDADDGCRIVSFAWTADGADAPAVVLHRVQGGGHTLPVLPGDPRSALPRRLVGPQCRDVRGVEEAWRFFAAHGGSRTRGD